MALNNKMIGTPESRPNIRGRVVQWSAYVILITWFLILICTIVGIEMNANHSFQRTVICAQRFGIFAVIALLLLYLAHFIVISKLSASKLTTALAITLFPISLFLSFFFMLEGPPLALPLFLNGQYGTEFSNSYEITRKLDHCRTVCYRVFVENENLITGHLAIEVSRDDFDKMKAGDFIHLEGISSKYGVEVTNYKRVATTTEIQ